MKPKEPKHMNNETHHFALQPGGEFKLGQHGQDFVSERRIALLEAMSATGSISKAAKRAGMGYKGAWDSIEQMNNLANQPLVQRQASDVMLATAK